MAFKRSVPSTNQVREVGRRVSESDEEIDVLELVVIPIVQLRRVLLPEQVGFVYWCPREMSRQKLGPILVVCPARKAELAYVPYACGSHPREALESCAELIAQELYVLNDVLVSPLASGQVLRER